MAKISNKLTIREAVNTDSSMIGDLIFDIWVNEYNFDVKKDDFPDLLNIEKYYSQSDGLFLLAIIDDVIVGTIACDKLNDDVYALKRMFVNKSYRKLGIAQALLDVLTSRIVQRNGTQNVSFYLSTKESEAIPAKFFYLKNGFKIIQRSELPINSPFFYKDDLFMHRQYKSALRKQLFGNSE